MTKSLFCGRDFDHLVTDYRNRAAVGLTALAVMATALTGCQSQQDKYCDAVKSHQTKLSQILDSREQDALLKALPIFEDLQGKAPDDVRDDWKTLVDALHDLQAALKDAGVNPATYDRKHLPAGVTQAERNRIDTAAAELSNPATVQAFQSVQQEARDVCQTPLSV